MNDYYVYVYYDNRQDPPTPFYVGKGRDVRYKRHLAETYANTENKKKYAVIQAIFNAGLTPHIEFYKTGLTETEAYDIEKQLIQQYGRRDIDESGILTNICADARPPNNKGRVRPRGKDHPNYGKKLNISEEERQKRKDRIVAQSKKQVGENNPFYGKTHSDETKALISKMKQGNKINLGRHPDVHTRAKIQLNNPNRKAIHTPYGNFISAEYFVSVYSIITANGLRNVLKKADKPINRQGAAACPLFNKNNIGKTPRELGWYFLEETHEDVQTMVNGE